MPLKIFYTVNAGLCFQTEAGSLLVDLLHQGKQLGFSATPNAVCQQMLTHTGLFQGTVCFVLTHLHPDHFDAKLMRRFLDENPNAQMYGPQGITRRVSCTQLAYQAERVEFGSFSLTAFQTVHDGRKYVMYPHRSLWLHINGQQHLVCGDAKLDTLVAERMTAVCGIQPDSVFVNVYQLSEPDGNAFLTRIRPKHIYLYHLPALEDDIYNYWQVARHLDGKILADGLPPVELLTPMSIISPHTI